MANKNHWYFGKTLIIFQISLTFSDKNTDGCQCFLLVTLSLTAKLPPFWKNTPQMLCPDPDLRGESHVDQHYKDTNSNWNSKWKIEMIDSISPRRVQIQMITLWSTAACRVFSSAWTLLSPQWLTTLIPCGSTSIHSEILEPIKLELSCFESFFAQNTKQPLFKTSAKSNFCSDLSEESCYILFVQDIILYMSLTLKSVNNHHRVNKEKWRMSPLCNFFVLVYAAIRSAVVLRSLLKATI